jgi:pseudaminic acid cytidylyltransferase
MIFAIIPARGGSKRIKNKNIKKFNLKPILYWTFKALKKSNIFSKIVITTDCAKIKAVAKKIGFDYIISRPENLSDDYTPTKEVIMHAIKTLKKKFNFKYVCCVYPCNPFLSSFDLKKSLKILKYNKKNFVIPVTEYTHPIQRSFSLNKKKQISFFFKTYFLKRTQDLTKSFHDAGQFYWGATNTWLSKKQILPNSIAFQIPKWRSVDIDNLEDWKKAELLFKISRINEKN